jgi:hypothetical protein
MTQKKTKTKLHNINGGGNKSLTRSIRNHPTYKAPVLKLIEDKK